MDLQEIKMPKDYDLIESIQNDLSILSNMSDRQIKAAYLANILGAALLFKVKDTIGMKILKDTSGKTLKKFNKTMSPLNAWGFIVHNSKHKDLKGILSDDVAKSLHKTAGRILRDTTKGIHYPISNRTPIAWNEMLDNIRVVTLRLPMRNVKINKIREGLLNWDSLDSNARSQIVNYTFYYMMENDKNSPLLPRIRAAANSSLLNASPDIEKIKKLKEEGEGTGSGAVSSGNVGSGAIAAHTAAHAGTSTTSGGGTADGATTGADSIAFVPFRLFKNKLVKRMKRDFKPLPTWRKPEKKKKKKKSNKKRPK